MQTQGKYLARMTLSQTLMQAPFNIWCVVGAVSGRVCVDWMCVACDCQACVCVYVWLCARASGHGPECEVFPYECQCRMLKVCLDNPPPSPRLV